MISGSQDGVTGGRLRTGVARGTEASCVTPASSIRRSLSRGGRLADGRSVCREEGGDPPDASVPPPLTQNLTEAGNLLRLG